MKGPCPPVVVIVSGCMVSAGIAPLSEQCVLWVWSAEGKNKAFFQLLLSCGCLSLAMALHMPDCCAVCACVCVTCIHYAQAHVCVHLDSASPLR